MNRTIMIFAALLMAAPAALADVPAGPLTTCERDTAEHHYGPVATGSLVWGHDGNLDNCGPGNIEVGLGLCLPETQGTPVCVYDTGVDQPVLDYDGDLEFANGGAYLFVVTGDGLTSGVEACFGAPSRGHHGTTVYAQDVLGFGPAFTVTSDYSRAGLEETPDCGDNYVEPCIPNPPAPSTLDFPLNVVVDTVNAALYSVFGPSGEGCNPLDNAQRFGSSAAPAPSGGSVLFGAAADGALDVFVEPDFDNARLGQSGHIWTA